MCAQVWHLGMYRDPKTLAPVSYYNKFPQEVTCTKAYVLDPMLATGGTAVAALATVKEWGCANVSLVCLLASPEGIRAVEAEHPGVSIYVCHVDERINEKGYILPGLGDAGDRIFCTEKKH
jgi:uracil phosphoribosyltransferase